MAPEAASPVHVPPRHVLYVTAARGASGGSRQILYNISAMAARGIRVTIVAPAGSALAEAAVAAGATVRTWPEGGSAIGRARRLRALADEGRADVVHACHTHAVKAAVLARLLGLRARLLLNRGVVASPNPLWGVFARIADGAIANSAAAAATLTGRLAPATRVSVVYNACPATVPSSGGERVADGAPLQVAWVGNANLAKGFDVLAAVARRVQAVSGVGAVCFRALGVRPDDRYGIASLAGDAVELGGLVAHDEVLRSLGRSHLLLLTSHRRESLPNVITEAFALGLPVVATDVGGVRELVRDGVNGYLCDVGDVTALADRVRALASNADERRRMGSMNRRLALERLSTEAKGVSLLRVYRGEVVVEPPPVASL